MDIASTGFFTTTQLPAGATGAPFALPVLSGLSAPTGQQGAMPSGGFALALDFALTPPGVAGESFVPAAQPTALASAFSTISLDATVIAGSAMPAAPAAPAALAQAAETDASPVATIIGTLDLDAATVAKAPVAGSTVPSQEQAVADPVVHVPQHAPEKLEAALSTETAEAEPETEPADSLPAAHEPVAVTAEKNQPAAQASLPLHQVAPREASAKPAQAAAPESEEAPTSETAPLPAEAAPASAPVRPSKPSTVKSRVQLAADTPEPREAKRKPAEAAASPLNGEPARAARDMPALAAEAPAPDKPSQSAVNSSSPAFQPASIAAVRGDETPPAASEIREAADGIAATPQAPVAGRNAAPAREAGVHGTFASHLAEPQVTARPGQIGREMGVEIARRVQSGGDELLVRLNPQELGRVEVRMSFDESGSLRALVTADSPAALDMLRRDAGDLGRALADAGVRADTQSLRFDARGGDNGGTANHRPQGGAGNGQGREGRAQNDNLEPDQPAYRPIRSAGQVDLMA